MREAEQIEGAWRRLLIARPGRAVDAHSFAIWLQGPEFFGDLRQPVGLGGRIQASCLAELTPAEAALLACQEGFAGRFALDGDEAEWTRELDFQPPAETRDRGRLEREGDLLIETGLEADYTEYWQRSAGTDSAAARLRSEDGRTAYLIRCGRRFLYARGRGFDLPEGGSLGDLVAAAEPDEARALLDCEISYGAIREGKWRIERSTLPWRAGAALLEPDADLAGDAICVAEADDRGLPALRRLEVLERRGALGGPPARPAVRRAEPRPAARRSEPFQEVPVVDVSALDGADPAAEREAVSHLRAAAADVGFLHVTGHGIAPPVIARLQAAARRFFALPVEEKMRTYIGRSQNHRGYVPEGEELFAGGGKDLKEAFDLSFDVAEEELPARRPMLGRNQWPELPAFREDVMAYYAAAFGLGRRLLRGFAMALGRPADAFDHLVTTPPSQLRLIHYPYDPAAQDVQGIGSHTDYEVFTMLLTTTPGLEVMNSAGEWIDAPPVEGGLVVNIGDMLEYWSGGAFVATSHRVRRVGEERYSFPLFFALDYDAAVRPLGADASAPAMRSGDHLYAQTIQTFRYLKDRVERGEIVTPQEARPLSSFGQEARRRNLNLA